MKTRTIILLVLISLAACSPAPSAAPTSQMEPTTQPEPTATATELALTEPPAPTVTMAPSETPTDVPTDAPPPLVFNFELSETNPALEKGATGEWDNFRVYNSNVIVVDDVFHMFYTGLSADFMAIGYALSSDGITFTKHDANPIFQADGTGFDAAGVFSAAPLVVGDTWMLYYNGRPEGDNLLFPWGGGPAIGLTTAPAPTGPWSEGQQVLSVGSDGEWDSGMIVPTSVFLTEDGYRMYYFGRQVSSEDDNTMCGMATSPDGIQWTKYDDPETTEPPFAESDPIFSHLDTGRNVECFLLKTDTGWEMFYEGYPPYQNIYYNTSIDGIHWPPMTTITNPIVREHAWPRVIKVDSTYYLYAMKVDEREVYLSIGTIERP